MFCVKIPHSPERRENIPDLGIPSKTGIEVLFPLYKDPRLGRLLRLKSKSLVYKLTIKTRSVTLESTRLSTVCEGLGRMTEINRETETE